MNYLVKAIALLLLAALCGFIVGTAQAADCGKHPIYCQIKKNRPKIDKKYAMKLSNIIYKMGHKHKIPTKIYTAILMQESLYRLKTNGCHKGLVITEVDGDVKYEETRICSDFGISQIYYKTARGFKIDIERLTNDLEYSVEAGAIVLADFKKRYSKREKTWWTRYNARSKDKRRVYLELVSRYL